ncbi:hypothetical protein [Pleurocapsa sp. PCC 7319]|uniref:hypothetical protein n=1 Tax=Pleurocapsa sp. PCC 7319 TaxID=118161 RepID=UPI000368A0C6|nr:hypothetical protein [Pleurocapsa sp. PCC 7319]
MNKELDDSARQPIVQSSSIIYEYLRQCAATQSPQAVIKEFRSIFLLGRNENNKLSQALEKIIFSSVGQKQFNVILTHCFNIILDCWSETPESLTSVSDLMDTLDVINQAKSYDRRRKQLIQLVRNYQQSELYFQLRGMIVIINPQEIANVVLTNVVATNEVSSSNFSRNNTIFYTYLGRYSYLYDYFLPQNSDLNQLRELIKTLQSNRKQDFAISLSKHLIYRVRLKQVAQMKLLSKGAGKAITKVDNPTLLSERAFKKALKQYIGQVENQGTILEQAQLFVTGNNLRNSYQVFKQDLYCFLTKNIKPRNSTCNFKNKLKLKLEQIFSQSDAKPLNKTLILQTCRQLFSFLILDPNSPPDPKKYTDLITNLGTDQVIMILIKITLICPESKADLEKKLSLIVTHYLQSNIQDIPWLVKSLEHLLIAFSIYFGKIDVSIARNFNLIGSK